MSTSDILWTLLSLFFIGLAYFAAFAFVAGLLWKLVGYLRTSTPLPHALTPAPTTEGGAVLRVLGEATLFQSLFKADKLLWGRSYFGICAISLIPYPVLYCTWKRWHCFLVVCLAPPLYSCSGDDWDCLALFTFPISPIISRWSC